jgi:predicted DNA-binding transcriptional regulator YafY
MQISRLFEIVYILLNKKTVTARELSEHFEVSQRTIYRDIETLCQAGIPIYTNKGKGGGIALMEHFVLNKSLLSDREQNEILSALQGLKATSYADTDKILSKLSTIFGSKNPDWIEVDFSYWNSNAEDKEKFQQLKEAILNHRVIRFDYYNSYGQESHRTLEPGKLIFKGQAWYLYGYCRDKKDERFFKISRMKALQSEDEVFQPRPFVLPEEKEAGLKANLLREFVFKADSEVAYRIYDEFSKEDIERMDDGSFLVHAKLAAGSWLTGYLMSYEDHIEVLEPESLREQLIAKYNNALKKYL